MIQIVTYPVTVFLVFLAGCTSYDLLKPVSPAVGNPRSDPEIVASLQPTLSWEQSSDVAVTYDLVIFECIKDESFWEGTKRSVGDRVYYREALQQAAHTVELPLKPGTEYYWSVRIRKGTGVSEWSHYDYTVFLLLSYSKVSGSFFRFMIPTSDHINNNIP